MQPHVLSARTAIITGASSGIGLAVARALAAGGAKLAINARRADLLKSIEEELNQSQLNAVAVAGDAADREVVEELFLQTEKTFKRKADLIVVNAGRGLAGSLTNAKLEEFDEVVQTNLTAAVLLMRRAAEVLLTDCECDPFPGKARDIVVVGSIAGRHLSPFSSLYGSTKFAVASLAEALRRELAPKGIRVSLVEPAIVMSGFQKIAGYGEEWNQKYASQYGPLLEPADVARLISFMVSQPPHVHLSNAVIRPARQEYP